MLNTSEIGVASGFIGILSGIYFLIYSSCSKESFEQESNRIVNTLTSVIKGEVRSLQVVHDENPYDLFTRIYPTLREMNNERIDEFITLLTSYNSNWIHEDSS
jgi:hypothetical protein